MDKKRSLDPAEADSTRFFADAESKNVLCRWRWSRGGDVIFQATCLYVTIESQFCGVKAELELNISMICGGGADAEQNFL